MNVSSGSPIRDISLLELNQHINKFIRNRDRRSGKRNHNVSREFIMPPKLLTRVFRQQKPTTVEQLKTKRTKKIHRLRQRDRAKSVGRAPTKNEMQKKSFNPSARAPSTQPKSPEGPEKKKPRKVRQKLALTTAHSVRLLKGTH